MKARKKLAAVLAVLLLLAAVPVRAADATYRDVSAQDWYGEAVKYVTLGGLMDPGAQGQFLPQRTASRGEIVTALYRLVGSPESGKDIAFGDVDDALKGAVAWAFENNVMNGVSGTSFAPASGLTREQLATILYRFSEYAGKDVSARADLGRYSDSAQISSWAADAFSWAVSGGVINGTSETTLSPKGEATRAQVAALVQRTGRTVLGKEYPDNGSFSFAPEAAAPSAGMSLSVAKDGDSFTLTWDAVNGAKSYLFFWGENDKEEELGMGYAQLPTAGTEKESMVFTPDLINVNDPQNAYVQVRAVSYNYILEGPPEGTDGVLEKSNIAYLSPDPAKAPAPAQTEQPPQATEPPTAKSYAMYASDGGDIVVAQAEEVADYMAKGYLDASTVKTVEIYNAKLPLDTPVNFKGTAAECLARLEKDAAKGKETCLYGDFLESRIASYMKDNDYGGAMSALNWQYMTAYSWFQDRIAARREDFAHYWSASLNSAPAAIGYVGIAEKSTLFENYTATTITVWNLSDKEIARVDLEFTFYDAYRNRTSVPTQSGYSNVSISTYHSKDATFKTPGHFGAMYVEAKITGIAFKDGSSWRP